jgi:hypothetical protein
MQVTDNPPRRIMMQRYVDGTEPIARRDRTLFLHMVLKVQKELVPSIGREGGAVNCRKEESWFCQNRTNGAEPLGAIARSQRM